MENKQIDKFSVSLAENLIDLLPGVCKILKLHDTETLNLTENNITGQDLTELQRHLNDLKVTSLCGLDLSNNENLGNLEQLGFLVLSRGLTDLTLMSCELTDDQLEILSAFQCSTVKSLNISHNRDITEKGLRCLEKLLQPHNIDYLDVSGCEMMRDKLLGLKDLFNNRKVMKLNCSYNDFRCDEMTLLGEMSTTAKVCEISVAGCDLDEIHLNAFSEALGNHKFDRVDAADNSGINGGMEEVAKLAKQCSSLDISECRIQPEGIDSFCRAMDKNAIETLNVSDSNRRLTGKGRALKSLLKLIPIVSRRLLLCFENVDTASRESLKTHLESSPNKELRIVFDQSLYCETQNGISFAMKKEEDSLKL